MRSGQSIPDGILNLGRIGLGGVVVDGADDYAANPGQRRAERGALQMTRIVASLHIFHLSRASGRDPLSKLLEFVELVDRSNAGQFEPGTAGGLFSPGSKFG